MAMKISVVTACFNSGATIKEALLSVAQQSYSNIEHVIVDGASKDDTLEIIKTNSIPRATIVSEPDNGIYSAWNKGIRRATGDYIWLLNSDDRIYSADTITDAVAYISTKKSPPFVYGKVMGVEAVSGYSYVAGRPTSLRDFVYGMRDFCILSTIIRRDVFERVGYFGEGYRISSDYEWAIRLFKTLRPEEIVFCDQILTNFSVGGVSNRRYREAYSEVAEIVHRHFNLTDYIIHRIYSGWRLMLMTFMPVARATGILSGWRQAKKMRAKFFRRRTEV